jgi:hypothetical protein
MMKSAVFKKVGIGLSSLFLITALGLAGCATQEQLNDAVKTFQKGMQK